MSASLKTLSCLSFVRLEEAVLCAECETISNSSEYCLACGSGALILLQRVLGGPLTGERAALIEAQTGQAATAAAASAEGAAGLSVMPAPAKRPARRAASVETTAA